MNKFPDNNQLSQFIFYSSFFKVEKGNTGTQIGYFFVTSVQNLSALCG